MSEKITTGESNQDTSTRWDSLAEAAADIQAPESTVEADKSIDIHDANLEDLNQADIEKLETELGSMLAENTREINEYQQAIEKIKKKQMLISQILHSLAELKEISQELNEFPFVEKEETAQPETPEQPAEEAPAKKKTAIELYEQMLEKRVNSGDLKREEADALYEKAQAKIKEHQAAEEAPVAEAPTEEPAKEQEENIDWADWRGMSREDWERYEARSKAHDAENLANLAQRNPELAEKLRAELNIAEASAAEAPTEEVEEVKESEEAEEQPAETKEDTVENDDVQAKKEELQKQIQEDESLLDEIKADIEALQERQSMQEFIDEEEESSDSTMPNFLKIKNADIKAKELSDMIRQQYSIIGGQRGMLLLSSQFENQNVGSEAYDAWWNELTEEGRMVIDELVEFAEENGIPEYAQESPINGGFLAWYKANAKHNG